MKKEIRDKIKRIRILTKRFISSNLSGDYLSAFKGSGMEFHQIREYQPGDDIRFIDWNNTVKTDKLMVKQYVEERDRTIVLMVDVSMSGKYSSKLELKHDLISNVTSALAFIADESSDNVGAMFFSDKVEKWIHPEKGHIHSILESLLELEPENKKTDISEALKFLIGLKKRNLVVFMLSDFIDDVEKYSSLLKIVSVKHDFIGIRILDELEKNIPDIGFIEVLDPETGGQFVIDTKEMNQLLTDNLYKVKKTFDKYKIDLLDLTCGHQFAGELAKFFHKRIRRSI